jgi:hypothetical protein
LGSEDDQAVVEERAMTIEAARVKFKSSAHPGSGGITVFGAAQTTGLKSKGLMSDDGTRRCTIPTNAPGYASWQTQGDAHESQSVLMKLPTGADAEESNAGGLKHEQYYPYGSEQWRTTYGMRNGVESVNRNLKRSQYEDIANPDKHAVRGNTFTYIVVALASVVENMRQMLSFYKRKLAIRPVTAKNRELPGTFWQSAGPVPIVDEDLQPPG